MYIQYQIVTSQYIIAYNIILCNMMLYSMMRHYIREYFTIYCEVCYLAYSISNKMYCLIFCSMISEIMLYWKLYCISKNHLYYITLYIALYSNKFMYIIIVRQKVCFVIVSSPTTQKPLRARFFLGFHSSHVQYQKSLPLGLVPSAPQ